MWESSSLPNLFFLSPSYINGSEPSCDGPADPHLHFQQTNSYMTNSQHKPLPVPDYPIPVNETAGHRLKPSSSCPYGFPARSPSDRGLVCAVSIPQVLPGLSKNTSQGQSQVAHGHPALVGERVWLCNRTVPSPSSPRRENSPWPLLFTDIVDISQVNNLVSCAVKNYPSWRSSRFSCIRSFPVTKKPLSFIINKFC